MPARDRHAEPSPKVRRPARDLRAPRAASLLLWGGALLGAGLAAHGYAADRSPAFFGGVSVVIGSLAALSLVRVRAGAQRLPLVLNGVVALLLGIVLLEVPLRLVAARDAPLPRPVYGFDEAQRDPRAFRVWAQAYLDEWNRTQPLYLGPDPRCVNPMVPIPGARFRFFDSPHRINALGFRGPEIDRAKGAHYRIVALGESTTFGATLEAGDRPWPEILASRIATDLACERPVQVINAGVPGWTLANNLARLVADVWPLAPDAIVSYHGYNGLPYLIRGIPSIQLEESTTPPKRPSLVLRRLERALRSWRTRLRFDAARDIDPSALETDLHLNRYAELYRELVFAAREARVHLFLATFSLAVDAHSPDPVISFYEAMFPDLRARILANRLHNQLVRDVGRRYRVPVIETSEGLDGAWQTAYIDPMHMTQSGRDRLAAHVLDGLAPLLAREAGCHPHVGAPR